MKWTPLTSGRCNGYRLLARIGIAAAARVQLPQLLLVLHPSILEPCFHLGLGQVQRRRQLDPFGRAQISLHLESRFQTCQLLVAEYLKP